MDIKIDKINTRASESRNVIYYQRFCAQRT